MGTTVGALLRLVSCRHEAIVDDTLPAVAACVCVASAAAVRSVRVIRVRQRLTIVARHVADSVCSTDFIDLVLLVCHPSLPLALSPRESERKTVKETDRVACMIVR